MPLELGTLNIHVEPDTFEPGLMSLQELHFLLEHLGEPANVALYKLDPEKSEGIIKVRVEKVLTRVYELKELQQHRDVEWSGLDAITDSITRYIDWHARVQEMKRRGFKRGEPSMFHWDEMGDAYKFAIGADSAELVRTEILDDGSRKPFAVKLTLTPSETLRQDLSDVAPWINRGAKSLAAKPDKLIEKVNKRHGTIECPICGKVEEFDSANRQKRMAAQGRMAKHLKQATTEVHRHRLLYRVTYK